MASRVPIVRQAGWLGSIPSLVVAAGLFVGGAFLVPTYGPLLGAAVFIGYRLASRELFAADHRRGMRLVRRGAFGPAADAFAASRVHFEKSPWIDRYRSIVMLSPAARTYREMAMANEAFALSQLGRRDEAIAIYERCLTDYPGSTLAASALRMLKPHGADVSR